MKSSEYFKSMVGPNAHVMDRGMNDKILALLEAVEGVSIDQYKWNINAARQQDATGFEYLYRAALALKEKE